MSKSLGNVVETTKSLPTTSADLSRFYMMRKCSPIDFMNFDLQELSASHVPGSEQHSIT